MTFPELKLPIKSLKSGGFSYKVKHEACLTHGTPKPSDEGGSQAQVESPERYSTPTKPLFAVKGEAPIETNRAFLTLKPESCTLVFTYPSCSPSKFSRRFLKSEAPYEGLVTLECRDITAVDLRVTSKFGSWDTMVGRILVECRSPVRASTTYQTDKGELIMGAPLNFRMVKATFPVECIQQARDILNGLKLARSKQMRQWKEKKGNDKFELPRPRGKIREGLPEWVNYIPYRWYSPVLRRAFEYLLVVYTILSLFWALWQLYKHVDFVKAYLRPLLDFIEYYVSILKSWLMWLDDITTLMSQYWWKYMKPFYIIFITAMAPIIQLFAPFQNIVNIIPRLFDPFIQLFNIIYAFLQPLIVPLYAVFDVVVIRGLNLLTSTVDVVLRAFSDSAVVRLIIEKGSQTFLFRVMSEILHGKLDPIKAQVVVVRDLIFKSLKAIYFAARFISSRVYYMFVFVKREQDYLKEENMSATFEQESPVTESASKDGNKPKLD